MAGLDGGRLRQDNCYKTSKNLLHCPYFSWAVLGTGCQKGKGEMEKRAEMKRDFVFLGNVHTLPLLWYHVCLCMFRKDPWGSITVTLLHNPQTQRKALEIVSTSLSGDETGLSSNKRIPEGICFFSMLG